MSGPDGSPNLRARALSCERGNRRIFDGLDFTLRGGGLLQVCGPNASGKTSLLRMVCGLLQPAAGTVEWDGLPISSLDEEYYRHLAYVGHLNGIKDELDAAENLTIGANLAGLPAEKNRVAAALREFGLQSSSRQTCKFFSQGQKRRLALARLRLSQTRRLWVLDEPFAALDTSGIEVLQKLLEEHLGGGGLAILTTHQEIPVKTASVERIELQP